MQLEIGLEARFWKISLEMPNKNFANIIEEEIFFLWENGTKYRFLYASPSRYMSSASDVFVQ